MFSIIKLKKNKKQNSAWENSLSVLLNKNYFPKHFLVKSQKYIPVFYTMYLYETWIVEYNLLIFGILDCLCQRAMVGKNGRYKIAGAPQISKFKSSESA